MAKRDAATAAVLLRESRETLALDAFKVDRVLELLLNAAARGQERIIIDPLMPLKDTKAARHLLKRLAELGYWCAWAHRLPQPGEPVELVPYHRLVVSIVHRPDVAVPLRLLEPDNGYVLPAPNAVPALAEAWADENTEPAAA